jgi:hypothetical protein
LTHERIETALAPEEQFRESGKDKREIQQIVAVVR